MSFSHLCRPTALLFVAGLISSFTASSTFAVVTSSGSVNPTPPAAGGSFGSTTLVVGDQDASGSDPLGLMEVNGGTTLLYDRLIIGEEEEYIGDVTVTGLGTTLELDSSFVSNPALQVGDEGTGFLTVNQGARLDVSDSNGNIVLGKEVTGVGYATIDGRFTRLIAGEDLIVGDEGYGELVVQDGALVTHGTTDDGTFVIGASATGDGLVVVDGDRSFYQAPEEVTIGVVGSGTLRISSGASFDANNAAPSPVATVGANGQLQLLSGGRFFGSALTVDGRAGGDGLLASAVTVNAAGELAVGHQQHLRVTGTVANQGLINVAGGEAEFTDLVTNTDPGGGSLPGRITVAGGTESGGTIRFGQALSNEGIIASVAGQTHVHGTLANTATGEIAVGGESNATFYDDVDVTLGELTVFEGATALFLGDLTFGAGAALSLALSTVDGSSDELTSGLQVLGEASLDGTLNLSLPSDFTPTLGSSFSIVQAGGGVTGNFATTNFPTLPAGLDLQLVNVGGVLTAQVVTLSSGPLDGDYNGDGTVDAGDYTLWRDSLGQTGLNLPADGNGSGEVDQEDYLVWKQNFGQTSAAASASSIPEPSTSLLALAALALIARRKRGI